MTDEQYRILVLGINVLIQGIELLEKQGQLILSRLDDLEKKFESVEGARGGDEVSARERA